MILKLHPGDNIILALVDLSAGEEVVWDGMHYMIKEMIPAKHKFAVKDIKVGDIIFMYGTEVGKATKHIPQGHLISTLNIVQDNSSYSSRVNAYKWDPPNLEKWRSRTFMGYYRNDGKVGTANYWLFIPLIFGQNKSLDVIRKVLNRELGYSNESILHNFVHDLVHQFKNNGNGSNGNGSNGSSNGKASSNGTASGSVHHEPENLKNTNNIRRKSDRIFKNIDGIKFLLHKDGDVSDDNSILCELFAGYICNPNVAGATVLSFGDNNCNRRLLTEAINRISPDFNKPMLVYEQPLEEVSELEFHSKVMLETFDLLQKANKIKRRPAPLSKLIVGLESAGNDGFLGITANPAMGYASDIIAGLGGSIVLSGFPELSGVEHEMINRCQSDELAEKFLKLQKTYDKQSEPVGSKYEIDPSAEIKRDGLITKAIKSAGAAKKGGNSPVNDVLDYNEQVKRPGLNLLITPGNEVESTTAMAGSGTNLILFSTGLGTPTGNPVVPVIKISTNSELAKSKPSLIDIDAGKILTENSSIQEMGEQILEHCIKVASGEIQTKSQQSGQDDFIPWKKRISP